MIPLALVPLLFPCPLIAQNALAPIPSGADARLVSMEGKFDMRVKQWSAPGVEAELFFGEVTWSRSHGERYVHGSSQTEWAGVVQAADTWIGWNADLQRYELTRLSNSRVGSTWMAGDWDAESERLILDGAQGGSRMEISFMQAGGFVEERYQMSASGKHWLASRVEYLPVLRGMARAPEETEVEQATTVPMLPGFNWAVVEVLINGEGPFRMIVDTGAGTTVLNPDLVEELGLVRTGTRRIGDPSAPLAKEVDELLIDLMQVGDAAFVGVQAVGWKEGPLVGMGGIRGVLGFPTFGDCLVSFDYPEQELTISPGELPAVDGQRVLDMGLEGIPVLTIDVAGIPVEAHLDTGNSRGLTLPASLMESLDLVEGSQSKGTATRASGPTEFISAKLAGDVRLGEALFERPTVQFDKSLPFANVGYDLLKDLRITFDQRNGRLLFERPQAAANQGPIRNMSGRSGMRRIGVQMAMKGGTHFSVAMVVPGSEGERAGLEVGDVFLELGGVPFTQQALMQALQASGSFTLTVERDGKDMDLVCFEESH